MFKRFYSIRPFNEACQDPLQIGKGKKGEEKQKGPRRREKNERGEGSRKWATEARPAAAARRKRRDIQSVRVLAGECAAGAETPQLLRDAKLVTALFPSTFCKSSSTKFVFLPVITCNENSVLFWYRSIARTINVLQALSRGLNYNRKVHFNL